jgi:hypothetical protein
MRAMTARRKSVTGVTTKPKTRATAKSSSAAISSAVTAKEPVESLILDQDLLARARREVPALREQAAVDLAGLRQLAGR